VAINVWILKSSDVNFFRRVASAGNGHELGAPHCGLSSTGVAPPFAMGQNHGNIPTFQELQAIMKAGATCGHLWVDMKTRPEYIAVKLAFLEAAGLPKPLWVPFKEMVVEYACRNLHDLQAL
jgi:hypothetical protein